MTIVVIVTGEVILRHQHPAPSLRCLAADQEWVKTSQRFSLVVVSALSALQYFNNVCLVTGSPSAP